MSLRHAALIAVLAGTATPALAQAPAGGWQSFVPPTDGSFQTWGDTEPEVGLVNRIFALSFAEECSWAFGRSEEGIVEDPETYEITYREDYDEADAPDRVAKLYRYFCNAGAYNEQHVYMLWEKDMGLRPIWFAVPRLDIRYVGDDTDGALESIAIEGFTAAGTLTNSWYDPATATLYTASYWRGLGDASSHASYVFGRGSFALQRYDVDPTYDGEINPFRIYDAATPLPVELVAVAPDDLPTNPQLEAEE